jgi:hypothetical protein
MHLKQVVVAVVLEDGAVMYPHGDSRVMEVPGQKSPIPLKFFVWQPVEVEARKRDPQAEQAVR